ncbi:putative membrane bound phosphohydrolase [Chlamydiales bacterium STE3]|nr:putative membrane bound phosphohydrolase [Chlamydiales bacterium STE3]
MNDKTSKLQNDTELKFSREQGFFDKSIGVTAFIGLFFCSALFLVLHFREVRLEVLDLNAIAPGYVIAQVDTDFFDEEATVILRQEAVRDIGRIYKLTEDQVTQRAIEFENFLINNPDWSKKLERNTLEEIYDALNKIGAVILRLRFTDARTFQRAKEVGFENEIFQIYNLEEASEEIKLPKTTWEYVFKLAFPHQGSPDPKEELVMQFLDEKEWRIEEDVATEQGLRRIVQINIPEKYTHISIGSRVIDPGEKVTARHLAIMQAIEKELGERRQLWNPFTLLGSLIMSLLLIGLCSAYFKINYPQVIASNRKLFLVISIVVLTLGLAKATEFFILTSSSRLIQSVNYPVFVPFAAILLASLVNVGVATFASGFLAIVLTMTLVFENEGFIIINLMASVLAILTTKSLRRRKEIFVVCSKAWLACILVSISLHLYSGTFWHFSVLADTLSTGVFMLLTAILVVGLLPLLESSFKVMTDATLMEYMDPNNDLLRRLSIEAPGTYQHSVVVGNLAETAALAIGANGLFCRVATLFHDIGKMATPQYFTENQQSGMNVHQLLTPLESAQVIIAHVPEGVAMARKAGLPEQFIDIIKEHHGTTIVYYFYRKFIDLGGDKDQVEQFRYAGPRPRSKESAIIMIADTLEAASRSLDHVNEESLTELASRLIREKADDGQFDDCLLTFEELAIVKATLIKSLIAFGHTRIKYPKREKEKSAMGIDG